MTIKTGIDIVYLPRFKKTLKRGGEIFLRRVFTEKELEHLEGGPGLLRGGVSHLAGIFAAKEATIKALAFSIGSWHNIKITYQKDGAPIVQIENCKLKIVNCSLSISHDGNYVIACFVALIK